MLQDEHYTSQTCPVCGHRKKPSGRIYRCTACGGVFHRDVVGAVNILSAHLHGEPGHAGRSSTERCVAGRTPRNWLGHRMAATEKPQGFSPSGVSREAPGKPAWPTEDIWQTEELTQRPTLAYSPS